MTNNAIQESTVVSVSGKVLVALLSIVAGATAGYTTVKANVATMEARIERTDVEGSRALRRHEEFAQHQLRIQEVTQAEIRGELKAIREILDLRLTQIEKRMDRPR